MATEQSSEELHQTHVFTVVKEEPPEIIETGAASFCYETVTKEEVILEDPVERADDQPEPTEIPKEHPFKCFECYRTFAIENNLKKCLKRHYAIRNKLYKCKFCGKCCGTKQDSDRHKRSHKRNLKKLKPPVQDILDSEKSEEISKESDKSNEINRPLSVQEQPESVSESPRGNSTEISKSHRFKCAECSKTFDKKHLRQRCEWKHKRCTGRITLQRHMRTHEKLRFTCNVCTQKFETSQGLHRHRHTTHRANLKAFRGTDNLYHCSRCDEPFPDWHKAAAHFKMHAPAKKGSLVKNSELESKSNLERHTQTENEVNKDQESSDIIIKNEANK